MNGKRKIIGMAAALLICVYVLSGCGMAEQEHTVLSIPVTLTGDTIQIEFEESDGYTISGETMFRIEKDGATVLMGAFMDTEQYQQYILNISRDTEAFSVQNGTIDENEYTYWEHGEEYNIIIQIKGTDTAVLLGSRESSDAVGESVRRLKFRKGD